MRVTPIAITGVLYSGVAKAIADTPLYERLVSDMETSDLDILGEIAGRACYKAYECKNPATDTTEKYLGVNILGHGHYSVLEHASVTFHVADVSRSLLLELERHRFLSFSVESQRYVDQAESHNRPVVPEDFDPHLWSVLVGHYHDSLDRYEAAVERLLSQGKTAKEARGAARAFLPESTPVDFVVTGNLRCWRDVLDKRYAGDAEKEIREFARQVLHHLRQLAPHSVQDIEDRTFTEKGNQ